MAANIFLKFSSDSISLSDKLLLIGKISIIIFMGFYLMTNFNPFYETTDGYSLAIVAIHLSDGKFTFSNELLKETGRDEFVPGDWGLVHDKNEVFPLGDLGFRFIATFFYIVSGNYGLFYLGPALGILALIIVERFSTKFFGKYCGFLTLLFLSTNHLMYRNFLNLQTEGLFLIFFILGCYFFLSFFKTTKNTSILFSSIFFVLATLTRISGVIYFPVELAIIGILILFSFVKKTDVSKKSLFVQNSLKNNSKIILYAVIPWIIFLMFWFVYNDSFQGDSLEDQRKDIQHGEDRKLSSLVSLESKNFENVKRYSKYLLPYQFPAIYNNLENPLDDELSKEWLGLLAFVSVIIMILISIVFKIKRLEIITLCLFMLCTIWFYSSVTTDARGEIGVPGRYMIPAFTLFYIILSFYIVNLFNWKNKTSVISGSSKIIKILILSVFITFFSFSIYFIPPIQAIIYNNFDIKNPIILDKGHPPYHEGLSFNDVILSDNTNVALEYDAIYFNIHRNDQGLLDDDSIELLNNILEKDHRIFIFKQETLKNEKIVLNDLVTNHGFIFKDFSSSFCQLEHKGDDDKKTSDPICLQTNFKNK